MRCARRTRGEDRADRGEGVVRLPIRGRHDAENGRFGRLLESWVTPYSFWAVTSLRTAPFRFHSPYSAISDLSPSSPMRTPLKILRTHLGILRQRDIDMPEGGSVSL
jgi:hypothetical protein